MLLVIDVGNSNTVLGVYQGNQLVCDWRIVSDRHRTVDEYAVLLHSLMKLKGLDHHQLRAAIISSVVPPMLDSLQALCRRHLQLNPLVVGPDLDTGMPVDYDNPHEVGADRIVNAVAAYQRWQCALIVIDFGTATTFDLISQQGIYSGGAIAPGIAIASEALFSRASKLPRVEFSHPEKIIARNTVNSIQAGIFFGYVGLVEGIVTRMQEEAGQPMKVIATGGLAGAIAESCPLIHQVEPHLTLEGLKIIFDRNQTKGSHT